MGTILSIEPVNDHPLRVWARQVIADYRKRKRQADRRRALRHALTQSQIDARPEGWARESDSTNARMQRVLDRCV